MYSSVLGEKVDEQLSGGPANFASFLNNAGITHLYTYSSGSKELLGFNLNNPRFEKVATVSSYGYEQGRVPMSLYKVNALPGDQPCVYCPANVRIEISSTYPSDDGQSYWASAAPANVNIRASGPLKLWNHTLTSTPVTFDVYSLTSQKIEINDSVGNRLVELVPNRGLRFTALASSTKPIRITAKLPCAEPRKLFSESQDPRSLCFNIFNIHD
jgi:hypothetical protein